MKVIETNLKINVSRNNKPKHIIIHHALKSVCTIYDVHNWHKNTFKWAGIGYHYFIDKKGNIYKGRDENQNGAHCKQQGMNFKSIGICLEGCYQDYKNQTDKVVPDAQLNALLELTRSLMNKYKLNVASVKKHHDYASYKLCPGNYFPWDNYITALQESNGSELEKENEQLKQMIESLKEDVKYLNDQWKKTTKEVFSKDMKIQELNSRIAKMKAGAKEIGEM